MTLIEKRLHPSLPIVHRVYDEKLFQWKSSHHPCSLSLSLFLYPSCYQNRRRSLKEGHFIQLSTVVTRNETGREKWESGREVGAACICVWVYICVCEHLFKNGEGQWDREKGIIVHSFLRIRKAEKRLERAANRKCLVCRWDDPACTISRTLYCIRLYCCGILLVFAKPNSY